MFSSKNVNLYFMLLSFVVIKRVYFNLSYLSYTCGNKPFVYSVMQLEKYRIFVRTRRSNKMFQTAKILDIYFYKCV